MKKNFNISYYPKGNSSLLPSNLCEYINFIIQGKLMLSSEFFTLLLITLVTIITPGPDFVVVVKNTISVSRRAGLMTSFGVSSAIWVHIFYSIFAVRFIANQFDTVFVIVQLFGAAYLFWLGWKALTALPRPEPFDDDSDNKTAFWRQGFINNLLNPKATVFFISIFSQVVAPDSSLILQIGYGLVITLICLSWFCLVSLMLTIEGMKHYVNRIVKPIEKIAGVIFISYAGIAFYNVLLS